MNRTLTTATGRVLVNTTAVTGHQFTDKLHVRTAELSIAEAAAVFSDPAETVRLIYDDGKERVVYDGFTKLLSIEPSPMASTPGELLIRLTTEAES